MFSARMVPVKKRIFVVSVDYDGCLGGVQFTQAYQAIQHLKLTDLPHYHDEYKKILISVHKPLLDDIIKKSHVCTEIQLMIGSNRQTVELDHDNDHKNKNGSCFEGITLLAETLGQYVSVPVKADLRVYGDAMMEKPSGHHAQVYSKQTEMGLISAEADARIADYKRLIGNHKYLLSFLQITTACLSNPDSEVIYQFYDDIPEILAESEQQFGQENVNKCLPPNLFSIGFSRYQDSIILSDFAQLAEKIRKTKDGAISANENDIELILRIASACSTLAKEFNAYLANEEFQSALTETSKISTELTQHITEINARTKTIKTGLLAEISKGKELLDLVKALCAIASNNCEYLSGKEGTGNYIEMLQGAIQSLADDSADHSTLFTIFADPNLLSNIRLKQPNDGFNGILSAFKKEYFSQKKEAESQKLQSENAEIEKLQDEKTAHDNLTRFFKFIPDEKIRFIDTAIENIEKSKRTGSAISHATLGSYMEIIAPISSLLSSSSQQIIMVPGSKQHTSAIQLGYGQHLSNTQEIFDRNKKPLYISSDKMLTSRQQIQMNKITACPAVTVKPETEGSLVLACTDQSIWSDSNNVPSLSTLHKRASSAVIYAQFTNLAANKSNFTETLCTLLANKDCNRATILAYFEEFKKRDGKFAFIHAQKNRRWDEVRFLFKSKRNSGQDEQTFWHTNTYMDAIKMLKNAYVARVDDMSANPDSGNALIDYYRGNKIAKPAQTKTRK